MVQIYTQKKKQLTHYLFFIMHVFLNVLQVERVPQHFQATMCRDVPEQVS